MLRLFLSHLGGEAIRTFALAIAPDLPPLACLAIGIAGGILIEAVLLWLHRRNNRTTSGGSERVS